MLGGKQGAVMTTEEWAADLKKTAEQIKSAPSDREAITLAFAELSILLLDIKATIEQNANRT